MKKAVVALFIISFLLNVALAFALWDNDVVDDKAGEGSGSKKQEQKVLLVKFKEGIDPQETIKQLDFKMVICKRLHSIKFAVTKYLKTHELKKDSAGRYVFNGKQYAEISEIPEEEIFKQAYEEMSAPEKSSYRTYKLVFPDEESLEDVIKVANDHPDIEYAEPDHKVSIQ